MVSAKEKNAKKHKSARRRRAAEAEAEAEAQAQAQAQANAARPGSNTQVNQEESDLYAAPSTRPQIAQDTTRAHTPGSSLSQQHIYSASGAASTGSGLPDNLTPAGIHGSLGNSQFPSRAFPNGGNNFITTRIPEQPAQLSSQQRGEATDQSLQAPRNVGSNNETTTPVSAPVGGDERSRGTSVEQQLSSGLASLGLESSHNATSTGEKPNTPERVLAIDPATDPDRAKRMLEGVRNAAGYLRANHFPIKIGDTKVVWQYDLSISRDKTLNDDRQINGNQKKRIVWFVMNRLQALNKTVALATNYKTLIFADAELEGQDFPGEMKINYYDEFHTEAPEKCSVFKVTFLNKPKELRLDDLVTHLSTSKVGPAAYAENDKDEALTALNIIFSYRPHRLCFVQNQPAIVGSIPVYTTTDGGKFYGVYDPSTGTTATGVPFGGADVRGGLRSILGFARSVRTFVSDVGALNLNINTSTGLFYSHEGTVASLIERWDQKNRNPPPTRLHRLEIFLTGLRVRTSYVTGGTDHFTTISGFAKRPPLTDPSAGICVMKSSRELQSANLTVDNYFATHHGRASNQSSRACYALNIGNPRHPLTFPADRLLILPGQLLKHSIDKPHGAIRLPVDNRDKILNIGRRVFYGDSEQEGGARKFKLWLSTEMLKVPVTGLPVPGIQYRKPKSKPIESSNYPVPINFLKSGSWNLKGIAFAQTTAKPRKWAILQLIQRDAREFCGLPQLRGWKDGLASAFESYGMVKWTLHDRAGDPGINQHILPHAYLPGYLQKQQLQEQYDSVRNKLQQLKNLGIDLVFVLLPSKDYELYSAVKRAGELGVSIHTICHVLFRGRPKTTADFYGNLCLKANLKTDQNTINQRLVRNPPVLTSTSMIMGIDVTHAGPNGMVGVPSVAAVVGSIDATFAQWPATLRAVYPDSKKASKEQIEGLRYMIFERLNTFYKHRRTIPTELIIYRDGLSEGQFEMCRNFEFQEIHAALDHFLHKYGIPADKKPKILLICAVKRHHTRLFPDPKEEQSKLLIQENKNPLPGTLVDTAITYGNGDDFFLISQKAIQGTARPVHYVILRDEIGCSRYDVAQMTHSLCYLFGRASRSVGLCTPAYYADLACDRGRVYVRDFYNSPKDDTVSPPQRPSFTKTEHESTFQARLTPTTDMQLNMWYL